MQQGLAAPAQVHGGVDRGRELSQAPVQVDAADLKRRQHAGAIGLHQHVVGQVVDLVEAHQAAADRVAVELPRATGEVVEHPGAVEVGQTRSVERQAPVAAPPGHPVEVALEQRRGGDSL